MLNMIPMLKCEMTNKFPLEEIPLLMKLSGVPNHYEVLPGDYKYLHSNKGKIYSKKPQHQEENEYSEHLFL